jgi:hypothetical protein
MIDIALALDCSSIWRWVENRSANASRDVTVTTRCSPGTLPIRDRLCGGRERAIWSMTGKFEIMWCIFRTFWNAFPILRTKAIIRLNSCRFGIICFSFQINWSRETRSPPSSPCFTAHLHREGWGTRFLSLLVWVAAVRPQTAHQALTRKLHNWTRLWGLRTHITAGCWRGRELICRIFGTQISNSPNAANDGDARGKGDADRDWVDRSPTEGITREGSLGADQRRSELPRGPEYPSPSDSVAGWWFLTIFDDIFSQLMVRRLVICASFLPDSYFTMWNVFQVDGLLYDIIISILQIENTSKLTIFQWRYNYLQDSKVVSWDYYYVRNHPRGLTNGCNHYPNTNERDHNLVRCIWMAVKLPTKYQKFDPAIRRPHGMSFLRGTSQTIAYRSTSQPFDETKSWASDQSFCSLKKWSTKADWEIVRFKKWEILWLWPRIPC